MQFTGQVLYKKRRL